MSKVSDSGNSMKNPQQQMDELADKLERARKSSATGKSAKSGASAAAGRSASRARLARRSQQKARPLPPPPARRKPAASLRPPAELSPETQSQLSALQRDYDSLESEITLSDVYDAIGRIESRLIELPTELDDLRRRGYVHSGQLEERLAVIDEQWDEVMPRIQSTLKSDVRRLDREMNVVESKVRQAGRGSASAVSSAESAVKALENKVNSTQSALRSLYGSIESELSEIERQLDKAGWMMDQLDQSPDINLVDTEGPIVAVESEWHRDGKEGPKGILYLTDQRLLFEQKEEVVTKKRFGLFKSESEMIHTLHLDIAVNDIERVEHSEEGGFMGMGKDDILELTGSANASVSRARFHLKGQDSSDWAAAIKRVKSGDIDADRHEEFISELADAAAVAASFPSQCPNCLANLPEPARGATRVTCEFCGSVVNPS